MKPKPEVSDATIVLINELFHLIGDTFSVTNNKGMPAKYFSPKIIGLIIGTIEQNKNPKALSKSIQDLINGNKDFIASNEAVKKSPPIIKDHERIIKDRVKKLATAISKSLCECGFIKDKDIPVSYPPYTTHTILLGFLYKLSTSKNDFRAYFEQLQATITSKSIFTTEGKKIFEKTDWNANVFDKNQVDSIINICSDESKKLQTDKTIPEFFKNQFEAVVFAEIIKQFYQQSLPQVIDDSSADFDTLFENNGKNIAVGFGDCTETTIRNLCNFILYNQDEGKFIPIKTESLNPSQELLDFYQGENADATKHTNPDKHGPWSNLMQNIPGVIYAQIISKTDPENEHYETDHNILRDYGKPCYVLLTQEELKKIDQSKISKTEENQTPDGSSQDGRPYSATFMEQTCKVMVGIEEDYIVAGPDQYIAYALWPSLKNIIILLNRLFGLKLYEDPLTPFKDEKFCSKYFPIMCEKFGWTYSGPSIPSGTRQVNLDTAYFNWNKYVFHSDNSGNNIHISLTRNSKAKWDINICKSHSEIKNVKGSDDGSGKDKVSGKYRPILFDAFPKSQESIILYDLLALYAPKTIDLKNLFKSETISEIRKKYLRILTGSPDTGSSAESEDENPLNLKLQKLKDSLFNLKSNLESLKTKLEALKSTIKN